MTGKQVPLPLSVEHQQTNSQQMDRASHHDVAKHCKNTACTLEAGSTKDTEKLQGTSS